ncbi:MAG: hypothetical protein OFPII_21790 [Osedax symbiont Rs1]|nr:MAG: hypothetical protein OFPII_21790 [Osedax symbiont Rs1]
MKAAVQPSNIPAESHIFTQLKDAYYSDAYSYTEQNPSSAMQIWLSQVATIPNWVNLLMTARNGIVSRLGLKHLGHISDVDQSKAASAYQVGDSVGIFTIKSLAEQEVILIDSDKHLDVQISIFKASDDSQLVTISSVVHVHNFFGEFYMTMITPLHKLIVPATIKRALLSRSDCPS